MKKVVESCPDDANQTKAGNSSYTANNVLDRAVLNTPTNEGQIRGIITLYDLENHRRTRLPIAPMEKYRAWVEEDCGLTVVEEAV